MAAINITVPSKGFLLGVNAITSHLLHPTIADGALQLLAAANVGVAGDQSNFGLFTGKLPATKGSAIAILVSGGLTPNPKWRVDFPSLQILIRGDSNEVAIAENQARAVKDALLGLPSQTLNGDRWVAINMLGDITNLGFDDENRILYSLNFSLIIEPITGTNRQAL